MWKNRPETYSLEQYISKLEQQCNDDLNLAVAVPLYYFNTMELEQLLEKCSERCQYLLAWQKLFLWIGFSSPFFLVIGILFGITGERLFAILLIDLFFKALCIFIGGLMWLKWRFEPRIDLDDLNNAIGYELIRRKVPPSRSMAG